MKRFALFTLLCLLPCVAAQESSPALSAEDLAALILGEGKEVTFLPGQLPETLTLPLPKNARLLGSATVGADEFVIALELEARWAESQNIINRTLRTAGWRGYSPFSPEVFQEAGQLSNNPPIGVFVVLKVP